MGTSKPEIYLVTITRKTLTGGCWISTLGVEQTIKNKLEGITFIEEVDVKKQRKANIRTIRGGRRQSDPIHYVTDPTTNTGDTSEQEQQASEQEESSKDSNTEPQVEAPSRDHEEAAARTLISSWNK